MGENEFKKTVAKNIILHRKRLGLTQLELAEKLNYTDKSVSKWERAESLPDTFILKQLADLFEINIDDLTAESPPKTKPSYVRSLIMNNKRVAIPLLSVLLNFFVATTIFCILTFFWVPVSYVWMVFIYAIPSAAIILIVFSALWWKRRLTAIFVSLLSWSLALSWFLSAVVFAVDSLNLPWLIFIIAGTFQVLIIIWFLFLGHKEAKKKRESIA